jgi:hypothetical protein
MKPFSTGVLLLLLGGLAGCGEDTPDPNGPDGVPILVSLSLSAGSDMIMINASESYTATAGYSDGSTKVVQATWTTDAPAVADVDATGRVTGKGPGTALLTAQFETKQASRPLRVVPNYQGRWEGDWRVTSCSSSEDWLDVCEEFRVGELFWISLVIEQNRDTVKGTTDFGDDLPGPVTGFIDMSGMLSVSGTYTILVDAGFLVELTVTDWETISLDNETMTGHMCVIGRAPGMEGSFEIDGEMRIVGKVGPSAAGTRAPARRRGLIGAIRGR